MRRNKIFGITTYIIGLILLATYWILDNPILGVIGHCSVALGHVTYFFTIINRAKKQRKTGKDRGRFAGDKGTVLSSPKVKADFSALPDDSQSN